ncbi:hypothetical protein C8R46DRAFT_1042323 [Mycena filopes]|nr:hypothetical protein C8R46DRAFT_1042323 [Mycena filopes]
MSGLNVKRHVQKISEGFAMPNISHSISSQGLPKVDSFPPLEHSALIELTNSQCAAHWAWPLRWRQVDGGTCWSQPAPYLVTTEAKLNPSAFSLNSLWTLAVVSGLCWLLLAVPWLWASPWREDRIILGQFDETVQTGQRMKLLPFMFSRCEYERFPRPFIPVVQSSIHVRLSPRPQTLQFDTNKMIPSLRSGKLPVARVIPTGFFVQIDWHWEENEDTYSMCRPVHSPTDVKPRQRRQVLLISGLRLQQEWNGSMYDGRKKTQKRGRKGGRGDGVCGDASRKTAKPTAARVGGRREVEREAWEPRRRQVVEARQSITKNVDELRPAGEVAQRAARAQRKMGVRQGLTPRTLGSSENWRGARKGGARVGERDGIGVGNGHIYTGAIEISQLYSFTGPQLCEGFVPRFPTGVYLLFDSFEMKSISSCETPGSVWDV